MRVSSAITAGALALGVSAENWLGFNTGATKDDRSAKFKDDFQQEFKTAQNLKNAPGDFNAARLFTNIQAYSESDEPIEAFEAAIETDTRLLLGVWASGTESIEKEISAFKRALKTHGEKLAKLVIGVSIGSEDLYRDSVTGRRNKSNVGNSPEAIVKFMEEWREAFKGSLIEKIPVGHVDTWDVWGNSSVSAVIEASDFVGANEYPYYQDKKSMPTGPGNDIKNAGELFDMAIDAVKVAVGDTPIWITETGWPITGENWDKAEPSVKNAKYFWDEVGCRVLFNKMPTFWYTLRDSNPDNTMKFAITKNLDTTPLFDLTCPTSFDTKPKSDKDGKDDKEDGDDEKTGTKSPGSPTPTGSADSGSSSPTTLATAGPAGGDSSATGTPAAGTDGASETGAPSMGLSLNSLSMGTYAALALVGGALALF